MTNSQYSHSTSTNTARVFQLRHQIRIIRNTDEVIYETKLHGHLSPIWEPVTYNEFSVSQNSTIPFKANYQGCTMHLRTYFWLQLFTGSNLFNTNIQMHSL